MQRSGVERNGMEWPGIWWGKIELQGKIENEMECKIVGWNGEGGVEKSEME